MLIAHISDPHITAPGRLAYGVAPVADLLARTVAQINATRPGVDLVLLTGDVTYGAQPEEAREARRILSQLSAPWYLIPGNHDDREVLWQEFGGGACPARHGAFLCYTVEAYPYRVIALDTTRPGAPGGAFCEARAAWLSDRLAEDDERPVLLMLHHPPLRCGVHETDEDGFDGHERLARIVADNRRIERLLCGHIHLPAHAAWQGSVVSVAPATGMELRLDLTRSLPSAFHVRAPGFLLHHAVGDAPIVTHLVNVQDPGAAYPFQESPPPAR